MGACYPFPCSPPRASLLLLILFLPFLSIDGLTVLNDTDYPDCPSFDCGDGVNISYPFWVRQATANAPTYCGYDDREITCNGSTPIFRTLSDNYTVKAIDENTRTISLVDSDVLGQTCPRARHNVSISSLLDYPPYIAYLVFLFNCNTSKNLGFPWQYLEVNKATCIEPAARDTYVFIGKEPPEEYAADLYRSCNTSATVVSPVLQAGIQRQQNNISRAFGDAMNKGFELQWKEPEMEDCRVCEKSDGRCGYTNQTGSGLVFLCFCKDGLQHSLSCQAKGNKFYWWKKVLIAVGGALLVGVILTLIWVYYRRRKLNKGRTSSLTSFFRSASTDPSFNSKDTSESLSNSYYTYQTSIFSYKELEDATGGFDASKELGSGGFGVVYKGKLRDGRVVAVKRLYEKNYRRVQQFRNEVEILNRLHHPNLVSLYGCTSSRELLLVYEFVPNSTVADHLHGSRSAEGALRWPVRMNIAIETAEALAYLHAVDPQIIHRDVKTSNILLDNDYHVKVADFGLSRLFPLDVTHVSTAPQGTPGYVDPEYHQCYQLTDKSDVYSFGVVLVELISSKAAVDIARNRKDINLSNMALSKIPNGLVHEMVDPALGFGSDPEVRRMVESVAELAFRCLQLEKDMRPTMDEVREALKIIAGGREPAAVSGVSVPEKPMRDDARLLRSTASAPFSPDSVVGATWHSRSTTPNTSA